jgi:hypothetical protein
MSNITSKQIHQNLVNSPPFPSKEGCNNDSQNQQKRSEILSAPINDINPAKDNQTGQPNLSNQPNIIEQVIIIHGIPKNQPKPDNIYVSHSFIPSQNVEELTGSNQPTSTAQEKTSSYINKQTINEVKQSLNYANENLKSLKSKNIKKVKKLVNKAVGLTKDLKKK